MKDGLRNLASVMGFGRVCSKADLVGLELRERLLLVDAEEDAEAISRSTKFLRLLPTGRGVS